MPETYGLPDPEPERSEQVKQAVAGAIAGQGVLRRVLLYAFAVLLVVLDPIQPLAVVPIVLLLATDTSL